MSKLIYENMIRRSLLEELSDDQVMDFIGDNLFMSLVLISRFYNLELSIGTHDNKLSFLCFDAEDISKVINNDLKIDEHVKALFCKCLSRPFNDYSYQRIFELPLSIDIDDDISVSFIDCDVEHYKYLEKWNCEENFAFKDKYEYFYERMAFIFSRNSKEIFDGNLNGKYVGLLDVLLMDTVLKDMCKKAGYNSINKSSYSKEMKEKMIEICIA